jgi:hypothetical protein
VPLVDPGTVAKTDFRGRSWGVVDLVSDEHLTTSHTTTDVLLNTDEVRLDEEQMFVRRDEEGSFVASFHFPMRGKARQFKYVVPIRSLLLQALRKSPERFGYDDLRAITASEPERVPPSEKESEFVENALADFEQLVANFMYAALPVLTKSAVILRRLNRKQPPPGSSANPTEQPSARVDRSLEFIVNRSDGWPVLRPRFRLHDVVRLHPDYARKDVDAGYLVPAADVERNTVAWGPEYREALAKFRQQLTSEEAGAKTRPAPTDAGVVLAMTSEGRKARKRITSDIARMADEVLFPRTIGRPYARTPEEKAKLAKELRNDLNLRRADYVRRGVKKTVEAIYSEMAETGLYGPNRETLSAGTIRSLLKPIGKRGEE